MSTRCVGVIVQMIIPASKCIRNFKHDTQAKCERPSMHTQPQEGVNTNTTNMTNKQRTKLIWQAIKEQCAQMRQAKHKLMDVSSTARSVCQRFLFHSWEVELVLKELIGWRGFWCVRGRSCWQNGMQGGAVRVHLMLSPVFCGAGEDLIPVSHRSTSSFIGT